MTRTLVDLAPAFPLDELARACHRGDDVRRYTRRDVFEEPEQMLRELRAALSPAAPARSPRPPT